MITHRSGVEYELGNETGPCADLLLEELFKAFPGRDFKWRFHIETYKDNTSSYIIEADERVDPCVSYSSRPAGGSADNLSDYSPALNDMEASIRTRALYYPMYFAARVLGNSSHGIRTPIHGTEFSTFATDNPF